jgi:ComF family protein
MSTPLLLAALVAILLAACLGLLVVLIVVRQRAKAEVADIEKELQIHKMNALTIAQSILDKGLEVSYQDRLNFASHALIFPPDGLIDERRAALEYQEHSRGHIRALLRDLKDKPIGKRRALLSARYIANVLSAVYVTSPWQADFFTAVPSTEAHTRQRGFNPAELIAVETADCVRLPYRHALARVRETASQRESATKAARAENVRDAFKAVNGVKGKRIVIVEDVVTTGATIQVCAAVLKAAGAEKVYVLSVFSVGRPRPAAPVPAGIAGRG